MSQPLLTIAIPTYNRSSHLGMLLSVLASELRGLGDRIHVLVLDNASPDDTPSVMQRFQPLIANLVHRRNETNIGPDHNIRNAYRDPATPYVWVIGDDDAPLPGAIAALLDLLESSAPDMVYLPSLHTDDLAREYPGQPRVRSEWKLLSRERFAQMMNVRFTFISGLVFRKASASAQAIDNNLAHTDATNLVQLAWTYEVLKQGHRFVVARQNMLMASSDNRGGYSVLQVFLVNHTRIVQTLLAGHPGLVRRILARTSSCFVPGLIWNVRTNKAGQFELPSVKEVRVPAALSRLTSFRLLVMPIWRLPAAAAMPFFQLSRVVARLARAFDDVAVDICGKRVDPSRTSSR